MTIFQRILLAGIVGLVSLGLQAQNRSVKGRVLDETDTPVAGAFVTVKGETRGVMTDEGGRFDISVKPSDFLIVSFLGYEDEEVSVGQKTDILVKLVPQTNTLATLVAMLRRGDDECTSERPIQPDLFEPAGKEEPTITGLSAAKEGGVVMQPKVEHEEIPAADEQPAEKPEEKPEEPKKEPKPKGPGAFSRMGKWFKDLAADLVEEK